MHSSKNNFEIFFYSANPPLAHQYANCLVRFPANWICFNEPEIAGDFLAKHHFDFVVLDLDSADGRSLLQHLCDSGKARQSVVLAVTSESVDASSLALCYEFGIYYPVRPSEVRVHLNRSLPVADRLAQRRAARMAEAQPTVSNAEDFSSEMPGVLEEIIQTSKAFAWLFRSVATSILCMRHSLSIAAQEWVASLLSAVATMWFVQESTVNFRGLLNLAPPSAGPTYLFALSLLLWICAKQRRFIKRQVVPIAISH